MADEGPAMAAKSPPVFSCSSIAFASSSVQTRICAAWYSVSGAAPAYFSS
jgi:hypothetical protein